MKKNLLMIIIRNLHFMPGPYIFRTRLYVPTLYDLTKGTYTNISCSVWLKVNNNHDKENKVKGNV